MWARRRLDRLSRRVRPTALAAELATSWTAPGGARPSGCARLSTPAGPRPSGAQDDLWQAMALGSAPQHATLAGAVERACAAGADAKYQVGGPIWSAAGTGGRGDGR